MEKLTGHKGSRYSFFFPLPFKKKPLELTGWKQKTNVTSSEFTRYDKISIKKHADYKGSGYNISFRTPLELRGWKQKISVTSSEFTRYEGLVPACRQAGREADQLPKVLESKGF